MNDLPEAMDKAADAVEDFELALLRVKLDACQKTIANLREVLARERKMHKALVLKERRRVKS